MGVGRVFLMGAVCWAAWSACWAAGMETAGTAQGTNAGSAEETLTVNVPAECVPVTMELCELRPLVSQGKRVVQTALFLDRGSVRVADADEASVTVAASVWESASETAGASMDSEIPLAGDLLSATEISFRLYNEGRQEITGSDGVWRAPVEWEVVAGEKIREELGRAERREEFLAEIEQIYIKKAEAEEAARAKAEAQSAAKAAETSADGNTAQPDAAGGPVEVFVDVETDNAAPAVQSAAETAGAEVKSAEPAGNPAARAPVEIFVEVEPLYEEGASPKEETAEAKDEKTENSEEGKVSDSVPPIVFVEIESHTK